MCTCTRCVYSVYNSRDLAGHIARDALPPLSSNIRIHEYIILYMLRYYCVYIYICLITHRAYIYICVQRYYCISIYLSYYIIYLYLYYTYIIRLYDIIIIFACVVSVRFRRRRRWKILRYYNIL